MAQTSRTEAVESIRQRVDIVELVARYVKLKKMGGNHVGVCPFHPDKSPSFSVSSQKGLFHCFGCKASGDVFSFLMRIEGKTFPDALEELAGMAGIELPKPGHVGFRNREQDQRLFEINESVADYFETQLWKHPSSGRVRDYLNDRRLSDSTVRRFRLGCAPSGWHNLTNYLRERLSKLQASVDEIVSLGLTAKGPRGLYDVFRGRIVFPIVGLGGKISGFGARLLDSDDQAPKYINSRQSRVFDKSEILYGLQQGRASIQKNGQLVLVEGYFDVLSLVEAGLDNVVATCGTALTERHARIVRRFASKVITVFDADPAGLAASYRAAEILLREDLSPYMVTLPKGADPDSFVRQHGGEKFRSLVEKARPTVELLADSIRQTPGGDVELKTQAVRKLIPLLSACNDNLRSGNYISWVSQRLNLDEKFLYNAVEERKQTGRNAVLGVPKNQGDATCGPALRREEEDSLVLLIKYPHLASMIADSGFLPKFESSMVRELISGMLDGVSVTSPASMLSKIEDQQLHFRLSAKVMNDAEYPEDTAKSQLEDCVRTIRLRLVKKEIQQLKLNIQQAEALGQKAESDQLRMHKLQLEKEQNSLVIVGGRS